jgi:hypothetical protein
MNRSRRNFLRNAAMTAPAVAMAGTAPAFPGLAHSVDESPLDLQEKANNGWLNVRDFGASGSTFRTSAVTRSGSNQITVADVGDFKTGQGVMISKCNIRYTPTRLQSHGVPYLTTSRPLNNSVEVRGYDGSSGSWIIYILDIAPSEKPAFRWTDDLGRNWHQEVPVTYDWQKLSGGVEIKLNPRDDWKEGYVITFGARDQLITRIEKIEGNVITLKDEANRSINDAVVRHNDTAALQEAVDHALQENLNVFVPVGHYMLANSIRINDAHSITIEGSSSVDTLLDLSEGEGACFSLIEGTQVIIRNFRMLGFMGFDERDRAGGISVKGSNGVWGFGLKHCNGITISNTERVLIENCHASKMSGECFVAGGRSRGTAQPGQSWSQWITYLRCSVTNSARNAFNDVYSSIENTSVINCRIVDVGGCSWEGASRFVKFIGNYVRNSGTVAIGNLGPANREAPKLTPENRHLMYPDVGAGQHIVADNVFESIVPYGGCAIRTARGGTQLIVRHNLFINFNSAAIESVGSGGTNGYASENTTITGNIFDMTCIGQKSQKRAAILVSSNDTIVSDNQIYVRGTADPLVTGIRVQEPALNVNIHDNLIRNCGVGILAEKGTARVGEVIDDRTFLCSNWSLTFPMEINRDTLYRNWSVVWRDAGVYKGLSVIEQFDPDTLRFRLREPRQMKAGDTLEFIAPSLQWVIHDNSLTDCLLPVVMDSCGSKTSFIKDNLVTRGTTANVHAGIEISGNFQLTGNRICDFDEENATALAINGDETGQSDKSWYIGNIFENCRDVVTEEQPGLWKNTLNRDNMVIKCIGKLPK